MQRETRPDPRFTASSGVGKSWLLSLAAVVATYVYFLIFAEFSFIELMRAIAPEHLRAILGALGVAGVTGAAIGAIIHTNERHVHLLAWSFRACAISAAIACGVNSTPEAVAAAAGVGLSTGCLTVTLAAGLRGTTGDRHLGLCIGIGTGLAYAICNLPSFFAMAPLHQALGAALIAFAASFAPRLMTTQVFVRDNTVDYSRGGILRWTVILFVLVSMDSAAFFIIQHTSTLRTATWAGESKLLVNAVVHLVAAVFAGLQLDRGTRGWVAAAGAFSLLFACLILADGLPATAPAVWFYTAGVSFYSTLLVEFPARSARPRIAATVFAISGWIGSAAGIGMAQDLHRIPLEFVLGAAAVIVIVLWWRKAALRLAVGAALLAVSRSEIHAASEGPSQIQRGREVYIAEGCMHCHSQFIRPQAPLDVERWGPSSPLSQSLAATPPLFGTRRQGPDLANVGNRRTREWNRLHLVDPRSISPGSRMPSYAYLFSGNAERGNALLAYLDSLGADTLTARLAQIARWTPTASTVLSLSESKRRFQQLCTGCHGQNGRGDGPLAESLSIPPADWTKSSWHHVPEGSDVTTALSRIIKFGILGLPMAGREYLPDGDVAGLARYVQTLQR